MLQFKCHKEVHAEPMTLGEYNKFRGWTMPEDEDPQRKGVHVVYNKDTPDEYHSWSPADIFSAGYSPMGQTKVEYDHIKTMIASLEFTFVHVPNTTITGCWAKLPNGFNVGYGESACVDPANYREDLGQQYARERALANATDELWKLEGYLLKVTGLTSEKF